jgi:hypothetical protein
MRTLALLLVPLFPLTACMTPEAKSPTPEEREFAAALAKMCDVDRQAGLEGSADLLGLGPKRTAWITENVVQPDIIELRTLMSVKGAPEQAVMLRARVKDACLQGCALADSLAKTGEGGLSP